MSSEVRVGLFVSIGIAMLLFLSTQVRDVSLFSTNGYELKVELDDVLGIEVNSKISANGLNIGFIKSMSLKNSKVIVTLQIREDILLPNDSIIEIRQKNMLSGMLLVFKSGTSDINYIDGDYIDDVVRYYSMDESADKVYDAANEFTNLIYRLQGMFNSDTQLQVKDTLSNINSLAKNLNTFVITQEASLSSFVVEANKLMSTFNHTSQDLNDSLPRITKKIENILNDIKSTTTTIDRRLPSVFDKVDNMGDNVNKFIETTSKPIENSLKTVDAVTIKLKDYVERVEKTRVEIGMNGQYFTSQGDSKSLFEMNLYPNNSKGYLFGLSARDDYSYDSLTNTRHIPKTYDDSGYKISAQLSNKIYKNTIFRAGLIESQGGIGIDYYNLGTKLKTSLDLYDFQSKNFYIKGGNPNLRVQLRYSILKYIDTYLGYENILNFSKAGSVTFGVGFRYDDEDFKTVIGVVGATGTGSSL